MPTAAYINGYQPHAFSDFSGGLNLRDKADAIGDREAIDLLNVTFTERGAIRQRDGYENVTAADLAGRASSMEPYYSAAGLAQLMVGESGRLQAIDQAGAVVGTRVVPGSPPFAFVRFGDPTHEYLFAANGVDPVQRWDGAAFATTNYATVNGVPNVAMPRGGAIAVTAAVPGSTSASNASNRMIATGFAGTADGPGGTASNPSRVYFSNSGQPTVWETDGFGGTGGATPPYSDARAANYIDLTPGDGERILAAVTWRELVFIFKETKFFVLWGETSTIGADGHTVITTFHVREVVNNTGLASRLAVCAGRDGVYFMNRFGIYVTNGGDPKPVSDLVMPMWTQDPDVYFLSDPINLAALDVVRMTWHRERVYIAIPTGSSFTNNRMLIYDTQQGWWSLYDVAASGLASFRSNPAPELHFGYATGPLKVARLHYGLDLDVGVRMISRWRSGWGDYGSSQQKTIRETKVWGSGAVDVGFSTDFNATIRATRTATLGARANWPSSGTWAEWLGTTYGEWPSAGQVNSQLVRYACRATTFSTLFSSSDEAPAWTVHRVARHMREIREPSIL